MEKAIKRYWPVFVLPTLIAFIIGFVWPFIWGAGLSFCKFTTVKNVQFVGLSNYKMIWIDDTFTHAFWFTAAFTVVSTVLINVLAFSIALLLTRGMRGTNAFRTIFFLPFTTSVTAGAIIWSYVYTDIYGTLTGLVSPLGLPNQIVPAMALMASWRDMGYAMLIFIAALQTVPKDYYEAATVEGANAWQQFIYITIPNIVPAFTTNVTLLLAWGLRTFDLPSVVAQNMQEGQTTAMYIYQSIFANNKASLGQAAAIILTIILIVLTQIVTRVLRRLEVEA